MRSGKVRRSLSCAIGGILILALGIVIMKAALFPSEKYADDTSVRISLGILAIVPIGFGSWNIVRIPFIERAIANIGFEKKGIEKARKKYLASRENAPRLDEAINRVRFGINHDELWQAVLRSAAGIGAGEQELINDSVCGEIFVSSFSVISVGREYTVYCGAKRNAQYVLRNDTARSIYRYIELTDMYMNFLYSGTSGEYYVIFDDGSMGLKMRCADHFDRLILDAYARTGSIPAGVIEYPPDTPPAV